MKTLKAPEMTKVKEQIAHLEGIIALYDITLEESEAAAQEVYELMQDLPKMQKVSDEKGAEYLRELNRKAALSVNVNELEMLKKTLTLDLFEATARYIIVSRGTKRLSSPSGFHPSELVFEVPADGVCILMNELPNVLDNLAYFDTNQIKKAHA